MSLAFRASRLRQFSSTTLLPYISVEENFNSSSQGINTTAVDHRPNFIHPSALIHPNAVLGQGVSIGPFCTIGASVVLGNDCHLYAGSHVLGNTQLGDNCTLLIGAVVGDDLPGRTLIGRNNVIGHHSVVGIKCQDMKYQISQTEIRGTLGTVNQLFICIGILAALVAGLPLAGNPVWWRTMFWISLVPSVLLALGMAFSPESPRWLFQQGKIAEAEMSIKRLFGKERVVEVMDDFNAAARGSTEPEASWFDLLSGRYRKGISSAELCHWASWIISG